MIVSVRESKARMSELLAKAGEGEEVIITVRGQPTARIVPIKKKATPPDAKQWGEELRSRLAGAKWAPASSSVSIINGLRDGF